MNYYKAREQDELPYLLFDQVAESEEEYLAAGLDTDPLVVAEEDLPSYEFGICHKRVVGGVLVARLAGDIDAQEQQVSDDTYIVGYLNQGKYLEIATFPYDSRNFPTNNISRERYQAIFDNPGTDYDVASVEGKYTLVSANIAAFKAAYQNKLLTVSAPAVKDI